MIVTVEFGCFSSFERECSVHRLRAGVLYPLLGEMTTMPGLPSSSAGERVDIDENGKVVGLS